MSDKSNRLHAVDGLRAFACLAVLILHCYVYAGSPQWRVAIAHHHPNPFRIFQFLNTGVNLFLLLSGFCLFLSVSNPQKFASFSVRRFATKRVWRIVPAYYATMAACALLWPILNWLTRHTKYTFAMDGGWPSPSSWILHLGLLHSLLPSSNFNLNGPFWTLGLEWEFYLIFPFVAWAFYKFGPVRTLAVTIVLTLVFRAIMGHFLAGCPLEVLWTWTSGVIMGRLAEFELGMLAAWLLTNGKLRQWTGWQSLVHYTATAIFVVLGVKTAPFSIFNDLFWSVAYFFLLMAAVGGASVFIRLFSSRPLTWLGERSYSVYLIHMPILVLISPVFKATFQGIPLFAVLAITLAPISIVSSIGWYTLFEDPFLYGAPDVKAYFSRFRQAPGVVA